MFDGKPPVLFDIFYRQKGPVPLAARSKAWVCRLPAKSVDSNPPSVYLPAASVVCCQVEVCATG